MANLKNGANGTSNKSVEELRQHFGTSEKLKLNYAKAEEAIKKIRDASQSFSTTISTFDKDTLRTYLKNISTNEKNLRNVSRFLYYRSHVYYRLVSFYATMPDLKIRQVIPKYDLTKKNDKKSMLNNYAKNLDLLERINVHANSELIWRRCLIDDVCYGLYFVGENDSFAYVLDPDYCRINGVWDSTNALAFCMDMSYWKSKTRQQELEWLGEPLISAYKEYEKTNQKWQQITIADDCYPFCFKFRMDDIHNIIPPFVSLFISLINLADYEEIQAIAEEQKIYKLIYAPMKTISGSNESDDFCISPDIFIDYVNKLIEEAIPEYCSACVVPGDELGVIDFNNNASSDTNSVSDAQSQILDISGGGMILNTSKITTQAGFEAALKLETEFALSSMLPQIDRFVNLILYDKLGRKAATVKHFEVSTYTKKTLADDLIKSCQYSFSNRLAYNTCLGISEKATLTMEYVENELLDLPNLMNHPLSSSFTQSGNDDGYTSEVGQGAPTKDADELSDSGSRSRDS